MVRLLHYSDPSFPLHRNAEVHPERPERLPAVHAGVAASGLTVVEVVPPEVEAVDLELVHDPGYIASIKRFCESGGGMLDPDTGAVPSSWEAALRAAGAGIDAVERLSRSAAGAAFLSVRPPGHHAERARAMGFCLFNNVAVTAARLAAEGERVAIVDWDVHHGNGTQTMFYEDSRVMYVSIHQFPAYPGTGWHEEKGRGSGSGATVNYPMLPGAGGDLYRRVVDHAANVLSEFDPDWLLVSAGYDAHARDPLAGIELESVDYGAITRKLSPIVPAGRTVFFLEGGYDLDALRDSVEATLRGAAGEEFDFSRHNSPPRAVALIESVIGTKAG